jgi:tripartite-type tricarboxylate transporter receptor subunit TctC
MNGRSRLLLLVGIFAAIAGSQSDLALPDDSYPKRPVHVVVPAPPGGGSDIYARLIAEVLSKSLGQPFVVENRPGAAGNIAADYVARAKPDGYTLLLGHTGISSINPWVYPKLSYDASTDLAPITQLGTGHAIVVVGVNVPVQTLAELIVLARTKPGQLAYGSAGVGSPQHVTGELFQMITGTKLLHVPYKGSAPLVTALIGGEIQVGFDYSTVLAPQVKAGRIRALAIAGPHRKPVLADVPTAEEAGLPSFESDVWIGYFAPTGTPKNIILLLQREVAKAAAAPNFMEAMKNNGNQIVASTPDAFAEFLRRDKDKWGKVVKFANVQLEQ